MEKMLTAELANLEKSKPQIKQVTFTLKGYEKVKERAVAGSFNYWTIHTHVMTQKGNVWQVQVPVEVKNHIYKFVVDGNWITVPANPRKEGDGIYTNSVIQIR